MLDGSKQLEKCKKCIFGYFYIDYYTGGREFECEKYEEMCEKIGKRIVEMLEKEYKLEGRKKSLGNMLGEMVVEDFFEGKIKIECKEYEEQ